MEGILPVDSLMLAGFVGEFESHLLELRKNSLKFYLGILEVVIDELQVRSLILLIQASL